MLDKKALVVGGGQSPSTPTLVKYAKQSELIVAADLGAEHLLKAGVIPNVIIGDMDSCSKGVVSRLEASGCETIVYDSEKDFTDLEASLDYCVKQGCNEVIVIAGMHGRRIDHVFGNTFLLIKYLKLGIRVRLVDDNGRFIEVISSELKIDGKVGSYISLIPITDKVEINTTEGLKYELKDSVLNLGSSLGLSNELVNEEALISVKSGLLLVIKELDS